MLLLLLHQRIQKPYRQRLTIELRVMLTRRWSRRRKKKRKTAKQHHQEQEEPIAHHEQRAFTFFLNLIVKCLPESGCSVVHSQSADAGAVASTPLSFFFLLLITEYSSDSRDVESRSKGGEERTEVVEESEKENESEDEDDKIDDDSVRNDEDEKEDDSEVQREEDAE